MGRTSSTPVALPDVNSHYGKQDGHIAALSMSFKVDNSNENSVIHIVVNVIENDRPRREASDQLRSDDSKLHLRVSAREEL